MLQIMKCENCSVDHSEIGAVTMTLTLSHSEHCNHCYHNNERKHLLWFCSAKCLTTYLNDWHKQQKFKELCEKHKEGRAYECHPDYEAAVPLAAEIKEEPVEKKHAQIEDFVLLMLGAPVLKIELDPQQLAFVVEEAEREIAAQETKEGRTVKEAVRNRLLQQGALANAKIILGRIRSKYAKAPGPDGGIQLDGPALVKEGRRELQVFKDDIEWALEEQE